MPVQKKLLIAVSALVAVFLVGSLGYYFIEEDVTLRQAAYQTLITISTVGYSEQWELSEAAHLWTSFIIVLGILVVTLAFAFLQATIVSGELRAVLGRRKLKGRIAKMSGHYIICGYGRMGKLICFELKLKGRHVIVVDSDDQRTAAIGEAGIDYVLGDATNEHTLREAGVDRAAALVSVLRKDADNVLVTLTVRDIREDLPIFARAEQLGSEPKLKRAGATSVICPQAIGATRFVNLITRPAMAHIFDITMGGTEWEIEEVFVQPKSSLVAQSLRDLNLREKGNIMVVGIKSADGKTHLNPGPDHKIKARDVMVVIAPTGAADALAG